MRFNDSQRSTFRSMRNIYPYLGQRALVRKLLDLIPDNFSGNTFHQLYHGVRKQDVADSTGPQLNNPHPVEV